MLADRRRAHWGLAALGLGAFVVGTAELVIVGVLDSVAEDADVSVSTAGTLVTAYALGVAVGGPIVTALTSRFDRGRVLRVALATFVIANLITVIATGFGVIVATRFTTGAIHGLFIGAASMAAADLVEPERQGRALAVVFGGITISTVVGVPLGTLIGQQLGWRATFLAITILGAAVLALMLSVLPPVAAGRSGRSTTTARSALAPRVLAVLGVGALIIGGQVIVLTFMAPFLVDVTGVSGGTISVILCAFGVATAAGAMVGGWAADRNAAGTLVAANVALAAVLGLLYLAGPTPSMVALALIAWGLVGFGLVSTALQLRVIRLAGCCGNLAASLGASAANVGIALGAVVGGMVVSGPGVREVAVVGAAILVLALPATVATRSLRPPGAPGGAAVGAGRVSSAQAGAVAARDATPVSRPDRNQAGKEN
jgi:DHA1 family inner membrane transport protein